MQSYIHSVPGRLRFKHPSLKKRGDRCKAIESYLSRMHGIDNAAANPLTGSIVVRYNTQRTDTDTIMASLRDEGFIHSTPTVFLNSTNGPMDKLAAGIGEKAIKAVASLAVSRVLESNGLSILAALI